MGLVNAGAGSLGETAGLGLANVEWEANGHQMGERVGGADTAGLGDWAIWGRGHANGEQDSSRRNGL